MLGGGWRQRQWGRMVVVVGDVKANLVAIKLGGGGARWFTCKKKNASRRKRMCAGWGVGWEPFTPHTPATPLSF